VIDPGIFKKYDIRGRAGEAITEAAAEAIGQAFGTFLRRSGIGAAVVGRDNRHSSPALAQAAIAGLTRAGCDVTDIGMVATPLVYWCAVEAGNIGGMMITGSHLKPDQNGFKLSIGKDNLHGEQIQALRQMIERGELAMATGRLARGRSRRRVVRAWTAMGGVFGVPLLEALGHRVTCLYCEPDGTYPNPQPDPQVPANLRDLCERVKQEGADLGLAFDGDADRVGVVDDQGNAIPADRVLILLARDTLARHPGATVVADVLTTQVLFDEVERAGGKPLIWISGHSLIKAKMAEEGALLGGEMSGHIFIADGYYGFDDGPFVAGRGGPMIAGQKQLLSQLIGSGAKP